MENAVLHKAAPESDLQAPLPFLVTSGGQTGAIWLGSALNKHPQILCTSGTDHPLMAMNYDYNEEEIIAIRASIKSPEDMRFGVSEGLASSLETGGFFKYGYLKGIKDMHGDIFTPMNHLKLRNNDYIPCLFDELAELPKLKPYRAFGNVRGVTAYQCAVEFEKGEAAFNGRGNAFPVADLTRDPIVRLDTVIHFNQLMYERTPDFKAEIDGRIAADTSTVTTLQRVYGVDFSNSADCAFYATEIMSKHSVGWADDMRLSPQIPRVLFEKLHSDRDYFAGFVHRITGGSVVADEGYLDWVFDPANIDGGRVSNSKHRKPRRTAHEIFTGWPIWWQEHVTIAFNAYDIFSLYEPLGYDLSFMRAL